MRRTGIIAIVALVAALGVALTTWTLAQARANDYMMVGLVVAEENVALEIEDQPGAMDEIVVDRVVAPDDSWLVVHLDDDGKPGMRVGLAAVPEGETRDVAVELDDGMLTDELIVALHGDRGKRGVFEFDMDAFHRSPDKPFFVDFEEVAVRIAVK